MFKFHQGHQGNRFALAIILLGKRKWILSTKLKFSFVSYLLDSMKVLCKLLFKPLHEKSCFILVDNMTFSVICKQN